MSVRVPVMVMRHNRLAYDNHVNGGWHNNTYLSSPSLNTISSQITIYQIRSCTRPLVADSLQNIDMSGREH